MPLNVTRSCLGSISTLPLLSLAGVAAVFLTATDMLELLGPVGFSLGVETGLAVLKSGPKRFLNFFFTNNVSTAVNPDTEVLVERLEPTLVLLLVERLVNSPGPVGDSCRVFPSSMSLIGEVTVAGVVSKGVPCLASPC